MPNEFIIKNGYFSQGNSEITGSLTVTAGITGSLQGTSSWANNATSASFATSAEFATSSSFAISSSNAVTASFALNAPQSTYYAAKLTQTSSVAITSGLLVIGESYEITTFVGGDNFSNVAEVTYGVINTTGCVFKATGTKPTTYTNGSTLTPLGYPIVENTPSMNTLVDGTIPYWRRLAAGIFHFNFTSSIDHIKIAPKFQPDSLDNYKTRAIVNQSNNAGYSFLDSRFATAVNAGGGFNSTIYAIDYQSDGKIIVGGAFTTFNGVTIGHICRLNPDGTEDTTFTSNIGIGFNGNVFTIKVQPDDKILVGGAFTIFDITTVNYICRLNENGTEDTAFTANTLSGGNNNVNAIKLLSDNSIIVGGDFTTWSGASVGYIAKLAPDGIYSPSFTTNAGTGFNSNVLALDIDPSDDIYVGGGFTSFDGNTIQYAAKMSGTGVQNSTFSTNMSTNLNSNVFAIRYNSNKVLIGGQFSGAFLTGLNNVCQINPNGTQDVDFTSVATNYGAGSGYGSRVYAIEAVADGWLVGGQFTNYSGITISYFNYIQNTGKQLNGYRAFGAGFNDNIYSLKLYPGNKVLVGGDFTSYDGVTNNYFANLYYTYDVVLIVDGDSAIGDGFLNKSSIEVTLYN